MKKLRVTIDGKAYEVLVEVLGQPQTLTAAAPTVPVAPAVTLAASPAPAAPTAVSSSLPVAGPGTVVSPLAGKMVSIDVTIGQTVAAGAQVATIEAMKMNTFIYAPKSGKVAQVLVNPGDAVEEGAALLMLD